MSQLGWHIDFRFMVNLPSGLGPSFLRTYELQMVHGIALSYELWVPEAWRAKNEDCINS
jgi:hypothetical protein